MLKQTYRLMLNNSKAAIDDEILEGIQELLKDIPESDYCFTNEPINNNVANYTLTIIITKRDIQEADMVAECIKNKLEENGIEASKQETFLKWDEGGSYYIL